MGPSGLEIDTPSAATRRRAGGFPSSDRVGRAGVANGTVQWVDASRAHGAIATEATAALEIWFHFSCVDADRPLTAGDRVEVRYLRLDLDRFRYVAHLVTVVDAGA